MVFHSKKLLKNLDLPLPIVKRLKTIFYNIGIQNAKYKQEIQIDKPNKVNAFGKKTLTDKLKKNIPNLEVLFQN